VRPGGPRGAGLCELCGEGAAGNVAECGAGDGSEAGQVTLLSIAFALLALALVLVIASASAVHIERKQLLALADAAAADAADAVDLGLFYSAAGSGGAIGVAGSDALPLSDATVRASVADYVATAPSAVGFEGLRVTDPTGTPDGTTAQVTVTAVARPPFLPWALIGWSDGIPLHATSTARAR
jgi:hypothetical protein